MKNVILGSLIALALTLILGCDRAAPTPTTKPASQPEHRACGEAIAALREEVLAMKRELAEMRMGRGIATASKTDRAGTATIKGKTQRFSSFCGMNETIGPDFARMHSKVPGELLLMVDNTDNWLRIPLTQIARFRFGTKWHDVGIKIGVLDLEVTYTDGKKEELRCSAMIFGVQWANTQAIEVYHTVQNRGNQSWRNDDLLGAEFSFE